MFTTIVLLAAVAAIAFAFSVKRGKLFVRAYLYLTYLDDGFGVEDANGAAAVFGGKFSNADGEGVLIRAAHHFAQAHFGGRQLPVIALARQRGFRG